MSNFDDLKISVEALTGGKNTVLLDDVGMPSIVVPVNKFKISDVIDGGSETVHPAFIVNGEEKDVIYCSKFLNVVVGGRAYSLAGKDPAVNITIDEAVNYSRSKGKGWSCMPFSLYQALALWCRKNGTIPRGNTNYGADVDYPLEKAVPTDQETVNDTVRTTRTATGTGPVTWNHNHETDGIADLVGNVWDVAVGARLVDGEIQIIPYANCFDPEVSLSETSTAWKAINTTGSLVNPGSNGSLKYNWINSKMVLTTTAANETDDVDRTAYFNDFETAAGLNVPEIVKALNLYPAEPGGDYSSCRRTYRLQGEQIADCGGRWHSGRLDGLFSALFNARRTRRYGNLGFRSAFCNL